MSSGGGRKNAAEILRERARELAREPVRRAGDEDLVDVLEFSLALERYAVEARFVREVRSLREFTPIPCTPPFVLGVINLRGRILSVIDMKKLFDLPEKGLTELDKILVLQDGAMELGVLADSVHGIRRLRRGEIQPPLPTFTGIRAGYLEGVTGERLIVLDAPAILGDASIPVDEKG